MEIEPVAFIKNRFCEKFGIPRQPGKVDNLSEIVFTEKYRSIEAVRGLEGFSHLWLIFDFSQAHRQSGALTVRPPRLGGNKRMGVFATRSPFRPNNLGLSAVKLVRIKNTAQGPVLTVSGADLLSDTPIYDIKPYIPYCDSIPDAADGFTAENADYYLSVRFDCDISRVDGEYLREIEAILREDPRPQYKEQGEKIYKMRYGIYDISFSVLDNVARVKEINEYKD